MTRLLPAVTAALAVLSLSACADTVIDVSASSQPPTASDDVTPTTTLPIVGTPAELLAEMAIDLSQLSAQIADDGDERATLARIEAIWAVARPEVESTARQLVGDIQASVDLARTAVVRVRPADADKAFSVFTDLVDRYTGDG